MSWLIHFVASLILMSTAMDRPKNANRLIDRMSKCVGDSENSVCSSHSVFKELVVWVQQQPTVSDKHSDQVVSQTLSSLSTACFCRHSVCWVVPRICAFHVFAPGNPNISVEETRVRIKEPDTGDLANPWDPESLRSIALALPNWRARGNKPCTSYHLKSAAA